MRCDRAVDVGGRHASCAAFGGADLTQRMMTTAREGIAEPDAAQGRTYRAAPGARGRRNTACCCNAQRLAKLRAELTIQRRVSAGSITASISNVVATEIALPRS